MTTSHLDRSRRQQVPLVRPPRVLIGRQEAQESWEISPHGLWRMITLIFHLSNLAHWNWTWHDRNSKAQCSRNCDFPVFHIHFHIRLEYLNCENDDSALLVYEPFEKWDWVLAFHGDTTTLLISKRVVRISVAINGSCHFFGPVRISYERLLGDEVALLSISILLR